MENTHNEKIIATICDELSEKLKMNITAKLVSTKDHPIGFPNHPYTKYDTYYTLYNGDLNLLTHINHEQLNDTKFNSEEYIETVDMLSEYIPKKINDLLK